MRKKNKNKSYGIKRIPGFAWDMPEDCKKCFFWNKDKSKCSLGGFDNCYYRISPPEKKTDPCEGCSYGKHRACIAAKTACIISRGFVIANAFTPSVSLALQIVRFSVTNRYR